MDHAATQRQSRHPDQGARSRPMPLFALSLIALLMASASAQTSDRRNWFNDPFEQATRGITDCPAPEGPLSTEAERKREAHYRIERGTTCWLQKKCEDANAYKRDHEINTAAIAALRAQPRLRDTSLWLTTQRKFVYVQGCVRNAAQRSLIVAAVRAARGVDQVIDELLIGARGKPPYAAIPAQ